MTLNHRCLWSPWNKKIRYMHAVLAKKKFYTSHSFLTSFAPGTFSVDFGWHWGIFDGKNFNRFFFLYPGKDVNVKMDLSSSVVLQMLNGIPHFLILVMISITIFPFNNFHLVFISFLSTATAVDIRFRSSTSVILNSKCSSSGTTWSRSSLSNGTLLQQYWFFLWSAYKDASVLFLVLK